MRALRRLEARRPGFFELRDLRLNRPTPNYLLHESAHAIAFRELFGRPRDVRVALTNESALLGIELGEAYAMTAEYLASAAISGPLHRFLFSVNSYRLRTPGKQAIGELAADLGLARTALAILLAFLNNLFFRERLTQSSVDRLLSLSDQILGECAPALARPQERAATGRRTRVPATPNPARVRRALSELMQMDSDFRTDTTRLFLNMFGRNRNVKRILSADPLALVAGDANARRSIAALIRILVDDAAPARGRRPHAVR